MLSDFTDAEIKDAFDQIDRALFDFFRDNHSEPTHILLDPRTHMRLAGANHRWSIAYIDMSATPPVKKLFNLIVIDVYRPYPFVAVARLLIVKGDHNA